MSDEPPPSSLRPRVRPEDAPPPAGVPVPPVAAESEPPSRLRLRPKLVAESAVAADSSVISAPESKDVPLKQVESSGLKHQSFQSGASPGGFPAPELPPAESGSLPKEIGAPLLFSETVANAEAPVAPLPAFHLVAASGATEATFAQQPPKSAIRPVPVRSLAFDPRRIGLVFGGLVLLAGGYFGYEAFFSDKSAHMIVAVAPVVASAPAKPLTAQPVAEIPAKLIANAQDTVIVKRESEQSRVDPLVETRETTAPPVPNSEAVVVNNPPSLPAPAVPTSLPKISEAIPQVPLASLAFRAWVDSAKITSVLEGASSRAIINGRLARSNEAVDLPLGIMLDHVDTSRRQIIFRDRSGATVGKSY